MAEYEKLCLVPPATLEYKRPVVKPLPRPQPKPDSSW